MTLAALYCHQSFTTGNTDWQNLIKTITKIENRFKSRSVRLRGYYRIKLLFFKGYANFALGKHEISNMYLKSLVDHYKKNSYTGIAVTLLGMMEDLKGNRELAMNYYKNANKQKKFGNLKEIIPSCLKEPYNPQKHVLILNDFFELPGRP
jgi:hypothetical protein